MTCETPIAKHKEFRLEDACKRTCHVGLHLTAAENARLQRLAATEGNPKVTLVRRGLFREMDILDEKLSHLQNLYRA